jgi:hypothetical protein
MAINKKEVAAWLADANAPMPRDIVLDFGADEPVRAATKDDVTPEPEIAEFWKGTEPKAADTKKTEQ